MRISADRQDSGYPQYCAAVANNKRVVITVDGVEQLECITADEDAGFAVVNDLDEAGQLQVDETGDNIKTKVVRGVVKVTFLPVAA